MIKFSNIPDEKTEIKASSFTGKSGVSEFNVFIRPKKYSDIGTQLQEITAGYEKALEQLGTNRKTAVLRRFFFSDLTNQKSGLADHDITLPETDNCAIAFICQPPRPAAKISMWAYHIFDGQGLNKEYTNDSLVLRRADQTHYWTTNISSNPGESSYNQTKGIFSKYHNCLEENGLTLADNVVRTWFFVQNVDVNYKGFVLARNEVFEEAGLTHETHYIASTGIEGHLRDPQVNTALDSYAISNISAGQLSYMTAPTHMCPTDQYGVTFERGTSVSYRDRRHLFISGTASIDNRGQVVHEGKILKQLERTVENVKVLLANSNAALKDIAVAIVYIRDIGDFDIIQERIAEYLPGTPLEVVLAPVCRPEWLVEIEAIAITENNATDIPEF
jgi:enamine deaminase RidA (YjgF/YER057c/UK114 family)